MTLTYRSMTVADLPAVFALRVSTIENTVTMQELEEEYGITPESLAISMQSVVRGWLCESTECVVGFAMGDRSNAEVQVVAVHPQYEGLGIGKTLLASVQHWLFSMGHKKIWLAANPDPKVRAYGFYRKLGWYATGEKKGDDEIMFLDRTDGR